MHQTMTGIADLPTRLLMGSISLATTQSIGTVSATFYDPILCRLLTLSPCPLMMASVHFVMDIISYACDDDSVQAEDG